MEAIDSCENEWLRERAQKDLNCTLVSLQIVLELTQ